MPAVVFVSATAAAAAAADIQLGRDEVVDAAKRLFSGRRLGHPLSLENIVEKKPS